MTALVIDDTKELEENFKFVLALDISDVIVAVVDVNTDFFVNVVIVNF